ncbi:MAG: NAD(P)H-dependent oxidoreductase [Gammaproteobacteria bacterium]
MSASPDILVLFAHLAIHRSKINRAMVDAISGLERVVFHDLLEAYPDFYIDIEREQALLRRAAFIVFQHPLYWYGAPAIFKHWQDVVLTRGFAYGEGGTALQGKQFALAVSTGGLPDTYRADGIHRYPLEVFLRPFEQMAHFCGMRYLPPLVLQGGHDLPEAVIAAHARRFRQWLEDYRPGKATGAHKE